MWPGSDRMALLPWGSYCGQHCMNELILQSLNFISTEIVNSLSWEALKQAGALLHRSAAVPMHLKVWLIFFAYVFPYNIEIPHLGLKG